MTEQEFLTALARRKGRDRPMTGRAGWASARSLPPVCPDWGVDALWERFARELEKLGGTAYRAGSRADAGEYVVRVAATLAGLPEDRGARGGGAEAEVAGAGAPAPGGDRPVVVAWDDPVVAALGLRDALEAAGLDLAIWGHSAPEAGQQATPGWNAKQLAARALAGITGVNWAVAETGTLLLSSGPGRGRLVSLLPPVHIALIRPDQLLPSLAEAVRRVGEAGELPSSLVLITGPSRSADIENDLSIGVHGPGSLHAVLLPE